MTDLSSSISKEQRNALRALDGPVLIIAGPGSGKTFTLVERIAHLIQSGKATAESLFIATFTDKAARELITRISSRLTELSIPFNHSEMTIGTFHSICLSLLEEHREHTRLKRNYTLLDQFDQQYFLYNNLNKFLGIDNIESIIGASPSFWGRSEELMSWLNKVSEEDLNSEVLKNAAESEVVALGEAYATYEKLLESNNALDFSTIQRETLRLLEDLPEILSTLRAKYTHIMVDEFQDTNTIQERILKLLVGPTKNICVVGDDDQGLYRFRGATIRNILEFPALFEEPPCQQIKLTTNYRSHPNIIGFCSKWMDQIDWEKDGKSFRFSKSITARDDITFPEAPTVLKLTVQGRDEYQSEVLHFLQTLKQQGKITDWNQIAFLFKSVRHDTVMDLSRFLERNDIPVHSPRSNMFFEREEVRLTLGAFLFMLPQAGNLLLPEGQAPTELTNYYFNQCLRLFGEKLRLEENNDLRNWTAKKAAQHSTLAEATDYGFSTLLYQLFRFPLFSNFLAPELMNGIDRGRAARNLGILSKLFVKFEILNRITVFNPEYLERDIKKLFNSFLRFVMDGGIDEFDDQSEYAPAGCVSFMTIHQSKGLEFPIVIVGSLYAGPRSQHENLDGILENNYYYKTPFEPLDQTKYYDFYRLFYTAFSRAQNLLVLSDEIRPNRGSGTSPSKYFRPMLGDLPNWNDKVVDLSALTFEEIKTINLKREYSFTSHITVFENCPEQYRFFRDLEFNPVRQAAQLFGTLVHQTIEDIHKTVLRGEQETISTRKIEDWFNSNYQNLIQREKVYLANPAKAAALRHVQNYYDRERRNLDRITEAEVQLSLVKEHYILNGNVDLIRAADGSVEIIDFKSERKPDLTVDRERIDLYQRQLQVYAHLVEEKTGQKVSRMHLYYTAEEFGLPTISFNKRDQEIAKTIEQFDQVVARIEAKDYTMSKRPIKLCETCDMKHYCDYKNWSCGVAKGS